MATKKALNPTKKTVKVFNRCFYYLGTDSEGTNYYLQEPTFDCNWYWGVGYVETFTNNSRPELSKDITSHQHFDGIMNDTGKNWFDAFNERFPINPFTENEIWQICELMRSLYTARAYSDMLHIGGAHYTVNPCKAKIQNNREYTRINEIVIPAMADEIAAIMGGR